MIRLLRRAVVCALIPVPTIAQQPRDAHISMLVAGGVSMLPDGLGTPCGFQVHDAGGGGPEAGVAFLVRMRYSITLSADTHMTGQLPFGCGDLIADAPVDTTGATGRHDPIVQSTVRGGVETPPDWPLFRATAGVGIAWAGERLPLGVVSLAWSTRGEGIRFLIEWERAQTRIHAKEGHHDIATHQDVRLPIVLYPAIQTFRLGLEVPLRSQ